MSETYALHPIGHIRSLLRALEKGLHRVTVREIAGARLRIGPIEAIDATPVVDVKAVLDGEDR